jgi:hypothetical protein
VYSVLLMTMIWRATARVQFFEASIVVCSIGSVITGLLGEGWDFLFFTAQTEQLWAQLDPYVICKYST